LRPCSRTSFHHQPEAQHPKSSAIHKLPADRLGRSLQDLIGFLCELHSLGIDLALHQQGIDTTAPAGKAMFHMMGVLPSSSAA
jgi:hypothetical protein